MNGQPRPSSGPSPVKMFCAYCGKSFTRKEHLERHIPTHTNVKPHRCTACQLSFARRDLLQRHYSTYHEARDPMEPLQGGVPPVPGRTPIACQNCANAKTGCDKRVPCARCAEKNLDCAARYARRSSKAAVRAAQASAAYHSQLTNPNTPIHHHHHHHHHQQQHLQTPPHTHQHAHTHAHQHAPMQVVNPAMMEIDPVVPKLEATIAQTPEGIEPQAMLEPRLHASPQQKSPPYSQHSPLEFPSPHPRVDAMDEFMPLGNEFSAADSHYNDLMIWPEYPLDLDMYSNQLPVGRSDMTVQPFADLGSEISSSSEPMATSSSRSSIHTRGTSILSTIESETPAKPIESLLSNGVVGNQIAEFEVVIAAEAAWPLARCNPPIYSGTCPRTAIVHLECLEQKSQSEGTWSSLEKYLEQLDWDGVGLSSVVPMTSRTRDKMLAITQGFLHKALDIHRGGIAGYSNPGRSHSGDFNFLVLPPSKIIEYFLRSYCRTLSPYYSLSLGSCVDPNEMLRNNQASTLLVLLMIAQGAAAVPMAEARYLSAGLTETCRISLFDIIEKNVELSADPTALRCALLFTLLGAWSGDKWLMDIAMGQRGMYLSMLKHAGMLDPQPPVIPTLSNSSSTELEWRAWCHRELQNRLVYNWVMIDQELSLFHDTAPLLSISELLCPLPGPDALWQANNADALLASVQSIYGGSVNVNPQLLSASSLAPSLNDLFQNFLNDNLSAASSSLSPQHLRLLLHPLQSLVCHLGQILSCFPDVEPPRPAPSNTVTKSSTLSRLEEVQALLQKWYELSVEFAKENADCHITRCNMVLYHLISLNAVTNFPEVERLARREGNFDGSSWQLRTRHKRCILQREEAIFHCGQVLRLLRSMPTDNRPTWWSASLYRAIMILWADSACRADPGLKHEDAAAQAAAPPAVAVDQVAADDPAVIAFVCSGQGVPTLTRADGRPVPLEKPVDLLAHGARELQEAVSNRISDGIRRKFITLSQNWGEALVL